MSDPDLPEEIRAARGLDGTDAAAELYARWAADYDRDVFERAGVIGTARIAELLARHLPDPDVAVLDLGCGTGEAGVRLRELGVRTIDGVDLSPEMLDVARAKGVYRRLDVVDLTRPDAVPPGSYDATIAAGVFTTGHLGAAVVPALAAITRPGGLLAWVVADPLWVAVEPALRVAAELVAVSHEPVRRGGAPEARFVVGRCR